jgi:GTPase
MNLPVVAIVGRPNVGKSTLFNRILGTRLAVVHDEPGITRDRLGARAEWNGVPFELVDTGGWIPESKERMDSAILTQVLRAMEVCDLVLFLVDARGGLHPHDEEIAQALFRLNTRTLLVVNKTDHEGLEAHAAEFRSLGMEDMHTVAAADGRGLGDLLDALVEKLPRTPVVEEEDAIRVAVLGRPNTGKSSLVNRLLREERMIVDDRPGTTRDAVDSPVRFHGRKLILVDTAGLRRRLDSQPSWEFYASLRALKALARADVAILVLDATEPIARQDQTIAEKIFDAGVGAVILVNKWDLVEKDNATIGEYIIRIREQFPFMSHVPVEFVSALTTQRINRVPEAIVRVSDESKREVPTSEWNDVLKEALDRNPPSSHHGQRPARIYYATQLRTAPPMVALFVSEPARVSQEYLRYLGGRFREAFGFEGNPIRLVLRKS